MALVVDVGITDGKGGVQRIELLEIRRLEPLGEPDPTYGHDLEVHPYVVTALDEDAHTGFRQGDIATLRHRYGDGARVLISNALAALGYPENEDLR